MFTPNLNTINTTNPKTNFKPTKHTAQDSIPSFIRKTYDILEENKFPDIIDWNPEGTALVIKKPADFCQKVLPLYFKHNNLTSFVRQLNMYNFHKRRTQNIDHVYAHELFQRGKKHLLKEIRRKSHDANNNNSTNSGQRSPLRLPDSFENAQNPQDINNIHYENQFLKKLYNDAMSKLAAFEAQINELSNQNRSLWSQLQQQRGQNIAPMGAPEAYNNNGNVIKAEPMTAQRQESELTLEKLPMTCGGISIPPLKLNIGKENAPPATLNIVKAPSMGINKFFAEESTEANESSFTSPSAQNVSENDNIKTEADGYQASLMKITPQVSQIQQLKSHNELRINRHDMSIGQLLDAWNVEVQDENGLLGKREPTTGMLELDFTEPALRRHELSIFPKKGLFSSIGNIFSSNNNIDDFDLLTFTN